MSFAPCGVKNLGRFNMGRKLSAEALGTAVLVFFACGVATLTFGKHFGFGATLAGGMTSAGIATTALAFGLVLTALAYAIGPISGCHVNPAVTMGALVAGRMKIQEAVGYWVAQFVGGIAGALALWAVFARSPHYELKHTGLGADGYGTQSAVRISMTGAFLVEVILTATFVFVILSVTSKIANAGLAGLAIGLSLTVVHLIGIPLTGTSVNPARSFGPALVIGGTALSQVWLFIIAPLVGGALAALVHRFLFAQDGAAA